MVDDADAFRNSSISSGLFVISTQLFATDPNAIAVIRSLCDIIGKIPSMARKGTSGGALHKVPPDLRRALSDSAARAAWEDITPLARNEWICRVISVKKPETRKQHIERTRTELKEGMRRPCCWPGCPHR